MLGLWTDVRIAIRGYLRTPGFTLIALLTLALGIGANSAVFSVVHPLLIERLPFDRPEQLVRLIERVPPAEREGRVGFPLNGVQAKELAERASTVEGILQSNTYTATLLGRGNPVGVGVAAVSEGSFSTLRAQPLLGRLIDRSDHTADRRVAVLSYAAWQRYWGGDSSVLGESAVVETRVGRESYQIIGVLPGGFVFPTSPESYAAPADLWVPGTLTGSGLATVLRLRDDVSAEVASAEVNSILQAMNLETFEYDIDSGTLVRVAAGAADLVPIKESQTKAIRPALLVLTVAVALVLLIACTNLANLMLGRSAARRREMAIRSSLGAGTGRLMRQVLTESVVLALAGGLAALVIAYGGVELMTAWPGNAAPGATGAFLRLPRIDGIEVDGAVLAFTFGIAMATGVAFGLAPALAVRSGDRLAALKTGTALAPRSGLSLLGSRDVLIVSQVAIAMALLVGAGLLGRSFLALSRVDPGFDTDGVVAFEVTASRSRFVDEPGFGAGVPYFKELADSLRGMAGVVEAGYGSDLFQFDGGGHSVQVTDPDQADRTFHVSLLHVSPGYLEAVGVPTFQGRALSTRDDIEQPMVMLVNRAFVRRHSNSRNPVGSRLTINVGGPNAEAEIVGVVGDVRRGGLSSEPYPQVFLPYPQSGAWGAIDSRATSFVVRASRPETILREAANAVHQLDPDARVERVMPLQEVVSESILAPRFLGLLLSVFAGIGVSLAAVGLFGVVAHAVTQRTKEIGIRLALGAERVGVLSLVLKRGAMLTILGIALGSLGAVGGAQYLRSMLFGVEVLDPVTFALAALGSLGVGLMAALVPALRATRVDPLRSLRHE